MHDMQDTIERQHDIYDEYINHLNGFLLHFARIASVEYSVCLSYRQIDGQYFNCICGCWPL